MDNSSASTGPTSLAGGGEEGGPEAVCLGDLLRTGLSEVWGSEVTQKFRHPMGIPWERMENLMGKCQNILSNSWTGMGKWTNMVEEEV